LFDFGDKRTIVPNLKKELKTGTCHAMLKQRSAMTALASLGNELALINGLLDVRAPEERFCSDRTN
jgi:hypothetical protein